MLHFAFTLQICENMKQVIDSRAAAESECFVAAGAVEARLGAGRAHPRDSDKGCDLEWP